MADTDSRSIAVDIQTRFRFYVLGLTFGILALSVQTASFTGPLVARIAELASWILLLASGLFGLSDLEWTPQSYVVNAVQGDVEERKRGLQKAKLQGATSIHVVAEGKSRSVEDLLDRADADMTFVTNRRKELNRWGQLKYKAQKATFVVGLVALLVARGLRPLVDVVAALKH